MIDEELTKLNRLIKPPGPPDRIFGWRDSQLSIARFYGGCVYQNENYVIDTDTEGEPLVRLSVLASENVNRRLAAKAAKTDEKQRALDAQGDLL